MKAKHILEKKITARITFNEEERRTEKEEKELRRCTSTPSHWPIHLTLAYRGRRDLNDERYHSLILAYANVA
jgi:hypothetical protein